MSTTRTLSPEQFTALLRALETIVEDRAVLAPFDPEDRIRARSPCS